MNRDQFVAKWRTRQDELARLDASVNGCKFCGEVLADFESVLQSEADELLSLDQASGESGYSPDHLRRMVRDRKVPATRRGRRLLFRAGDLPKKPRLIDAPHIKAYDPAADARRVATHLKEEQHG